MHIEADQHQRFLVDGDKRERIPLQIFKMAHADVGVRLLEIARKLRKKQGMKAKISLKELGNAWFEFTGAKEEQSSPQEEELPPENPPEPPEELRLEAEEEPSADSRPQETRVL